MFRHTEEHQLPLLWWCALSAGGAPGFPVCWLWPIMLFAQTLFLIGLHPLPWQRGWGNAFEGLYCSLLLFYTLFIDDIFQVCGQWWAVRQGCSACTLKCAFVLFCVLKLDSFLCKGINQHQSFPWSLPFYLHSRIWQTFICEAMYCEWDVHTGPCMHYFELEIWTYFWVPQSTMVYAMVYTVQYMYIAVI